MSRAAFRQADVERIIRAARRAGAIIKVDIRKLEFTIYPTPCPLEVDPTGEEHVRYGSEDWDDYDLSSTEGPRGPRRK